MNIGKLGEDIASKYLYGKGFRVKQRNYRIIFGEIDIVAEKDNQIHFIEVKTLSHETGSAISFKPEDAVGYQKQKRLKRAIQGYLKEHPISHETEWQFDIISIYLDAENKKAMVRFLENLVL